MNSRKVAVLSDIHSNYHAFQACYEDALQQGADSFIFLGDFVSDLAEPERVMDLLYKIQSSYPTLCLRGNRERYMIEQENGISKFTRGSKCGSLLFTYEHLRKHDIEFFKNLQMSSAVNINGIPIELAHAAMENDRCYFDSNDNRIEQIFTQMNCEYLLTGHSHKQYILNRDGKTIVNPGSVGIPQGGTIWPQYAIMEFMDGNISFALREVPYDMRDIIHAQFASGLVDYAKFWAIGILYDIITGEEWVLKLLKTVQSSGNILDELEWQKAAIDLGMKFTEDEITAFLHDRSALQTAGASPRPTISD